MAEGTEPRSFLTTLPGILSSVAGLLGAIAGVLGALAAIGVIGGAADNGAATVPSLSNVRVSFAASIYSRYTHFTELNVKTVPPGTRITLTCKGGGCFKGERAHLAPDGAEVVFLTSKVPKELEPGAVLTVRLARDGAIGKIVEYRMARQQLPERTILCVPPGESPVSC